jgi:hypothetical protein
VACFRNAARHLTRSGRFVIELEVLELRRLPPSPGLTSRSAGSRRRPSATTAQPQSLGHPNGQLDGPGRLGAIQDSSSLSCGDATYLAVAAVAMIVTVAVLRSQALRPLTPQFDDCGEDDEEFDFGEDA